jgi:hypothetical protein
MKHSKGRRALGAVATRYGTYTAEQLAGLGPTQLDDVYARTNFPIPTYLLSDYPLGSDLKDFWEDEIWEMIKAQRKISDTDSEYPRVQRCADKLEKLGIKLMRLPENHPAYNRCSWEWLKPLEGSARFVDQFTERKRKVKHALYEFCEMPDKNSVDEFLNYLEIRLR